MDLASLVNFLITMPFGHSPCYFFVRFQARLRNFQLMLPNKLNVPGKQIMSQHAKEKTKNRNNNVMVTPLR
jgi:hypothetical protein